MDKIEYLDLLHTVSPNALIELKINDIIDAIDTISILQAEEIHKIVRIHMREFQREGSGNPNNYCTACGQKIRGIRG